MAKINILQWLYKHSPVNFYSITSDGETIIKSINNTFVGYKFDKIFSLEQINNLRNVIKHFKRLSTIAVLLFYICLIYGFVFPHYDLLEKNSSKIVVIFSAIIFTFIILFIISKIFEFYLYKKYGKFEKTHFPSSNFIENQSYKEFKIELIKIFVVLVLVAGICFGVGSPCEKAYKMLEQQRFDDVIKITTVWSKILPMDPECYSLRGYAKFYNGDYEGAIEDYDKSYRLKLDEYKSMSFDNKIYIKYFLGDYKSALEDFDEEIKNIKNEGEKNSLIWDKAQFLYNIGLYKKSLALYNDLIEKSVEDRVYLMENRLYYERAQVYSKLKMEKEALADINKAEELNLDLEFQKPIPEPVLLLEDL